MERLRRSIPIVETYFRIMLTLGYVAYVTRIHRHTFMGLYNCIIRHQQIKGSIFKSC